MGRLGAACFALFFSACSAGASETPPPAIDPAVQTHCIRLIEANGGVREAAITQDGPTLSLVLIVDHATSGEAAMRLGDNFVRLVKNSSEDAKPGKEIGPGVYHYTIGVYDPSQRRIALGAKAAVARKISW